MGQVYDNPKNKGGKMLVSMNLKEEGGAHEKGESKAKEKKESMAKRFKK